MESVKNGKVGEGKWSKFAERRREDEKEGKRRDGVRKGKWKAWNEGR